MKVNSEIGKGTRNPVEKNNNPGSAFGSKKPKQETILDSNQADYTTDTSINLSPSKNTEGVNQIGSQTKNKTKQFQIDSIDLDEYNNENISNNIATYSGSGQATSASSSSIMNPTGNKQIPSYFRPTASTEAKKTEKPNPNNRDMGITKKGAVKDSNSGMMISSNSVSTKPAKVKDFSEVESHYSSNYFQNHQDSTAQNRSIVQQKKAENELLKKQQKEFEATQKQAEKQARLLVKQEQKQKEEEDLKRLQILIQQKKIDREVKLESAKREKDILKLNSAQLTKNENATLKQTKKLLEQQRIEENQLKVQAAKSTNEKVRIHPKKGTKPNFNMMQNKSQAPNNFDTDLSSTAEQDTLSILQNTTLASENFGDRNSDYENDYRSYEESEDESSSDNEERKSRTSSLSQKEIIKLLDIRRFTLETNSPKMNSNTRIQFPSLSIQLKPFMDQINPGKQNQTTNTKQTNQSRNKSLGRQSITTQDNLYQMEPKRSSSIELDIKNTNQNISQPIQENKSDKSLKNLNPSHVGDEIQDNGKIKDGNQIQSSSIEAIQSSNHMQSDSKVQKGSQIQSNPVIHSRIRIQSSSMQGNDFMPQRGRSQQNNKVSDFMGSPMLNSGINNPIDLPGSIVQRQRSSSTNSQSQQMRSQIQQQPNSQAQQYIPQQQNVIQPQVQQALQQHVAQPFLPNVQPQTNEYEGLDLLFNEDQNLPEPRIITAPIPQAAPKKESKKIEKIDIFHLDKKPAKKSSGRVLTSKSRYSKIESYNDYKDSRETLEIIDRINKMIEKIKKKRSIGLNNSSLKTKKKKTMKYLHYYLNIKK